MFAWSRAYVGHCGLCWDILGHVEPFLGYFVVSVCVCWLLLGKNWDHIGLILGHLGSSWAIFGSVSAFVTRAFSVVDFSSMQGVCKKHQKYQGGVWGGGVERVQTQFLIYRTGGCSLGSVGLTPSFFVTPSFTYNFVTHNFFLLLDPPPPSLSFLPSPSRYNICCLLFIIGRSWLVGLSGPLICVFVCLFLCSLLFWWHHTGLMLNHVEHPGRNFHYKSSGLGSYVK